jgi:MerR family mercuric resistance operon transcriptional regulator
MAPCREVREIAANHLEEVRTKIADLKKLERLLGERIGWEGARLPRAPNPLGRLVQNGLV